MKKFSYFLAAAAVAFGASIATPAFAHGGAGGGGGARVIAWQKAHPAVCALDGNKLVLISDPSKACLTQ